MSGNEYICMKCFTIQSWDDMVLFKKKGKTYNLRACYKCKNKTLFYKC